RARPLSVHRPCGADVPALLLESLGDEERTRRPRAAPPVEHSIDLPLGQERVVRSPRLGPVCELRQPPELLRERNTLVDGPLQPLLPHRDVEPGLAKRSRERAECVPIERLRGEPALVLVDVARGGRPAELLAERAQKPEQLLA